RADEPGHRVDGRPAVQDVPDLREDALEALAVRAERRASQNASQAQDGKLSATLGRAGLPPLGDCRELLPIGRKRSNSGRPSMRSLGVRAGESGIHHAGASRLAEGRDSLPPERVTPLPADDPCSPRSPEPPMRLTDRVKQILSWYPSDNPGTKMNLARMLNYGTLAGTGNMVILPVDQGFEHGPARSFAPNPAG